MAKKKEQFDFSDESIFQDIAKSIGGDILNEVGKCPGYIDSGVLSVNFINSGKFVGGGFPIGSMVEILGPTAAGKSLIGTNLLRGCQTYGGIPVFHDAERAINKEFAIKASHVDPLRLIVSESDTLVGSFNKIHKLIRQCRQVAKIPLEKPIVIIYDSIAVSPSDREYAQTTIDMEEMTETQLKNLGAGAEQPGERAKICSRELRKLMPIVKSNNVLILFINQLRKMIGVLFGNDTTTAGGGEALKYYCSTRVDIALCKRIKNDMEVPIGMNVTFENIKSRFTSPFRKASRVRIFFDKGIDPFGGLLELLLQEGRVESIGPGWFIVKSPWNNGKEIKFRSSKERNDVPYEALLKCPQLVDADSPEQIKYYIDMFGQANEASNANNIEEDVNLEEID